MAEVDYHNQDALQFVLNGIDLVVSTISGVEQLNLIDAARRVRVRCFVPSEFEGSLRHRPTPGNDPFDNDSSTALEQLRHWSSSRHYLMRYTVFSCGIFYERFAPGGLGSYRMGATCRLEHQGDYMIDVGQGTAELPATTPQGQQIQITMTSALDVARFVAAAVDFGIDRWPSEFKMRGTRLTPQRILQHCVDVRNGMYHLICAVLVHEPDLYLVEFTVITRPYAEIVAWADHYQQNQDEERWFAMQHLLQTANGRYTFSEANLNELVNIQPLSFRDWLQYHWGPVP